MPLSDLTGTLLQRRFKLSVTFVAKKKKEKDEQMDRNRNACSIKLCFVVMKVKLHQMNKLTSVSQSKGTYL